MEDASPGVAERYAGGSESSSSEGDISGQRIDESYEDIHLRETKVSPEGPEGEGVSRKNLLERRNSVPLKLSSESPQGTSEGKGGKISLVELDLETLEGMPTTPAPRHSEQFVSPKSLSMSPNIKVLDKPPKTETPTTYERRRQQLIEHTANLWQILDDICEHSTLTKEELSGTTERITKLKAMNEELGALESEMEVLHSVYTFESKSCLKKLRKLEEAVYAPVEESESFGQAALDRSFSRSVFKILYDDKKGMFQLVSAKLEDEKKSG